MHKTRAITVTDGKAAVGETQVRDLQDGEFLSKALYTTVSPGTELRVMNLRAESNPGEAYVPGYTHLGEIVESKNEAYPVGALVFSSGGKDTGDFASGWGGHIEYAIAEMGCLAPEGLDALTASLAALGGIAHHGVAHADAPAGAKALVIGLGPLGQLCARMLKDRGCEVTGCDLVDERIRLSNAAGIPAFSTKDGLVESVQKELPGGAPVVFDATGSARVFPLGLQCVSELPWDSEEDEPARTYVIQGSYPGDIAFNYQEAFKRQLTLLTPRNRQWRDCAAYLKLVADGHIKADDLICRVCKPEEADEAYASFKDQEATPGTIAFDWREA